MKFNDAQRKALGAILGEKAPNFPACAACRSKEWRISGGLLRLAPYRDEPDAPPAPPLVTFTCGRCGHVLLFNARTLGLPGLPEDAD